MSNQDLRSMGEAEVVGGAAAGDRGVLIVEATLVSAMGMDTVEVAATWVAGVGQADMEMDTEIVKVVLATDHQQVEGNIQDTPDRVISTRHRRFTFNPLWWMVDLTDARSSIQLQRGNAEVATQWRYMSWTISLPFGVKHASNMQNGEIRCGMATSWHRVWQMFIGNWVDQPHQRLLLCTNVKDAGHH